MVKQFIDGALYLFRGMPLFFRPGIRLYIVVPLLLNILLFGLCLWYGYGWLQEGLAWVDAALPSWLHWVLNNLLPSWLHWLQWLVVHLFITAMAGTVFFCCALLVSVVASPFNSLLAEQVEFHLTSRFPAGEAMVWEKRLVLVVPMLWSELSKVLYTLLWALPLLLLFIVPVVNVAAPFLWVVYSAWMLALQYLDLPASNRDVPGKQLRYLARQQRPLLLGFGCVVLLLTIIPVINFFAAPAAVVGATMLWVERFLPAWESRPPSQPSQV